MSSFVNEDTILHHPDVRVKFGTPRGLHAMLRPEFLNDHWIDGRTFERNRIVQPGLTGANLTRRMSLTQVDVFNERDVSIRMPIQRVKNAIERHHIQHLVNRFQYFTPVLLCWAIGKRQASTYEIILNVDDNQCTNGTDDLHNRQVEIDYQSNTLSL